MKTRYFFIIGILLFIASGITPPLFRRFVAEPGDSILFLGINAVLVITSVALILAGMVRFKNERQANDGLKIDSPD